MATRKNEAKYSGSLFVEDLHVKDRKRKRASYTGADLLPTYSTESYASMNQDTPRNSAYARAIELAIKFQNCRRFLEIGPGASAFLTRMVLECKGSNGGKDLPTVLAVEGNSISAAEARRLLHPHSKRCTIISSLSSDKEFLLAAKEYKPEVLLQEVLGFLASSEGIVQAISTLQREGIIQPRDVMDSKSLKKPKSSKSKSKSSSSTPRPSIVIPPSTSTESVCLPAYAATFGVLTNVSPSHVAHNAELYMSSKFMLVKRLQLVDEVGVHDKVRTKYPGCSLPNLVPGAGAGTGCLSREGFDRLSPGTRLPNSFCFEFFDFQKDLTKQSKQTRVAEFHGKDGFETTINSISFFIWASFPVSDELVEKSSPNNSSLRNMLMMQRNIYQWTEFPYGCSGLLDGPLALDAIRNSFSTCNVDGNSCCSSWRNMVLWLPKTLMLTKSSQTVRVTSIVDVTTDSPLYSIRVDFTDPNSPSSNETFQIDFPMLYPYFEKVEASNLSQWWGGIQTGR
jgi:hypothetical protein